MLNMFFIDVIKWIWSQNKEKVLRFFLCSQLLVEFHIRTISVFGNTFDPRFSRVESAGTCPDNTNVIV